MPEPAAGADPGAARGQLADAIEALPEGVALFDADGALVLCNAAYRRLNPALAGMLVPGVSWEMLLRGAVQAGALEPAAAERLRWLEARLDLEGRPQALELEGANGRTSELALAATRAGGFVLSQRDVTARRRLEAGAREAEALLREVLESCPAHVVMSRLGDGRIMYRSPAATELLGPTHDLNEHFASRDERADFVTALLPGGRVDAMPVTCHRSDGRAFPAAISARLIDYRGEEVVVSSIVDLTREVEMRAELAAQRETIFQAEKMSALGELLAGVAHELNNPLSVMVGHALMLREEATDSETLRRTEKIGAAAERCARIVKSFLAMARQEPAVLAPVDLNAVVETAVDAARGGPGGLYATIEVAPGRGLPKVMADADQLAQVVVNLLVNAEQAIARDRIGDRIRVTTAAAPDGRSVVLEVSDNGPGVPEALRGRIFEPLFTTKAPNSGTGLGLALCHRIVTSHGGRISLEANPGVGARFVVRLPAATVAEQAATEQRGEPLGRAAPARVLLIDDEADVAELMREILQHDGFEVDHAVSGEAALALLAGQDYAAILSDLAMPGMGGRGFLAALEHDRPQLAARVAFVTGDTMGPAARTFLAESARPHLEKPIAPADLRALVRQLIVDSGPRRANAPS
jgi:PAS domain S-box-containing protein